MVAKCGVTVGVRRGDSSGDFDVVKLGSANNYPQVKIVTVGLELKF